MSRTSLSVLGLCLALCLVQVSAQLPNLFEFHQLSSYRSVDAQFDMGWAQESVYRRDTRMMYVLNKGAMRVEAVDVSTPSNPTFRFSVSLSSFGSSTNSIAIASDLLAVVVTSSSATSGGTLVFIDSQTGTILRTKTVGVSPKHVAFSPDLKKLLVTNEGPYDPVSGTDPLGTITIIRLFDGVEAFQFSTNALLSRAMQQSTLDFRAFNFQNLDNTIRIIRDGASLAEDIEPETISFETNSYVAWITCQENNALVRVDIGDPDDDDSNDQFLIDDIWGLGFKRVLAAGNGIDGSSTDGMVNIENYPVRAMPQADGIYGFNIDGTEYVIVCNEGAQRDGEATTTKDVVLDFTIFPAAENLQNTNTIGDLQISPVDADTDHDGDFDVIFSFGSRSISIWDVSSTSDPEEVFESGSDLEEFTARVYPSQFNSANDENQSFDSQSPKMGPQPKMVTTGKIEGTTYAFVALHQIGGIVMYELDDVTFPSIVGFINWRDFAQDVDTNWQAALDLGPTDIDFVSAHDSPNGEDMIILTNSVSGTVTLFRVRLIQYSSFTVSDPSVTGPIYATTGDYTTYDPGYFTNRFSNYVTYFSFGQYQSSHTSFNNQASSGRRTSPWYTRFWVIDNFKGVYYSSSDASSLVSQSSLLKAFLLLILAIVL